MPKYGYTVGEASQIAGVSPTTVRVWERDGLVQSVRSASGYRYFGEQEIAQLRRIAYLRSVENLNTAAIRRIIGEESNGRPRPRQRREIALGSRLRQLRKSRRMTLEQAASASGLSPSFLSSVERDKTGIAPATLHRLVQAYGATLTSIMRRAAPRIAQVKRPGHRAAIRSHGVVMEQLVDGNTLMDPHVTTFEPGAGSGGAYSHEGEEFIYVLQGVLEILLAGGERYRLDPGESIYYPSTIEHSFWNPGTTLTSVLWINTPPTF
jgi:DNA-binding transcriptional MerR regulator/quercetin dioxygenase-like cupin family protein